MRLLPMRKSCAALVGAGLWVVVTLFVSSWRQGLTTNPWWQNLLRAGVGFLVMFLVLRFGLWLPDWAKRKVEAARREGRLK